MLLYLSALAAGRVAPRGGSASLVRGPGGTGRALPPSPLVVGLPFVSLDTSAPEPFVSTGAAWQGYGDVAAGNASGSNIVNLRLLPGLGTVLGGLPIGHDIRDRRLAPVPVTSGFDGGEEGGRSGDAGAEAVPAEQAETLAAEPSPPGTLSMLVGGTAILPAGSDPACLVPFVPYAVPAFAPLA